MLRIVMWLLLVLGFGLLLLFAVIFRATSEGVNNLRIARMVETRFCQPDETVIQTDGRQARSGSGTSTYTSTLVFCEAEDGTRRDITLSYAFFIMPFAGVPFFTGLVMLIGSAMGIAYDSRRRSHRFQETLLAQGYPQGIKTKSGEVPSNTWAIFEQVFTKLEDIPQIKVMTTGDSISLTDRLKQLEQARDMALITDEEYEHGRSIILDQFGDGDNS